MTTPTPEPQDPPDQDAEPSLNAPEEGGPDGIVADDDESDDDE